jgi:amidohydrolase
LASVSNIGTAEQQRRFVKGRGMSKEALKQRVCEEIDRHGERIIDVGERIFQEPELGFKEFKTAKVVHEVFDFLELEYESGIAITGAKSMVKGGKAGPTVAVLGELDSVLVADHPSADPETGAAHCCGHNAQIAGMIGTAMGLLGANAFPELAGRVSFMAVPAEEYVEISYRNQLRKEGKLEFLGGKSEMIALGAFDDVDMAMMVHAASHDNIPGMATVSPSHNGFIGKQARFIGRASHAGAAPDRGINALYAANLALSAINAQRETFKDNDAIRIHPILTRAGDLVNVIPNDVQFETMIRGKTAEAIQDASKKVDRALRAGAVALGATVEIETIPGYMPLFNNRAMVDFFRDNFLTMFDCDQWHEGGHKTGSTDMGDLATIMPVIHPSVGGFSGAGHGSDWAIVNKEHAYLTPAKLMAMTVIDLLYDDAAPAKEILERDKPLMTKDEYLAFMRNIVKEESFDGATVGTEDNDDA